MALRKPGLVPQILIGVALGAATGVLLPALAERLGLLGSLFVGMLKAVAPLLVMVLVMSAIANRHESGLDGRKTLLTFVLYLIGTVSAASLALLISNAFPQTIALSEAAAGSPPGEVGAVLKDVLFKLIDNPVNALLTGNFLGCLSWAVLLGLSFRKAPEGFRRNLQTLADGVSDIVRYVIRFAPVGIFGLVCVTVATVGLEALAGYANLAVLLVAAMLIMALVINPLIVFVVTRANPYPIVFRCLEESGITAFFTRSSAANIPVNLALSKTARHQRGTLFGDHSGGGHGQHGGCGDHDHGADARGHPHARHRRFAGQRVHAVHRRVAGGLRRERRAVREPAARAARLLVVRHLL